MICIKTGFYARLPSGFFIYGDAFAFGIREWTDEPTPRPLVDLMLRVVSMSDETPHRIHIELRTWERWFDEPRDENLGDNAWYWRPSSTLIANAGDWSWYGYEGVEP